MRCEGTTAIIILTMTFTTLNLTLTDPQDTTMRCTTVVSYRSKWRQQLACWLSIEILEVKIPTAK